MARFVRLHVHTEYSLVDGVVRIESEQRDDGSVAREGLIDACARLGMPAVALTDQGNLFPLVKFYRTAGAGPEAAGRCRCPGPRAGRTRGSEPPRAALS